MAYVHQFSHLSARKMWFITCSNENTESHWEVREKPNPFYPIYFQCWSLLVNLSFGDPHWPSWHILHLHSFKFIYIYIYISVPGASKFAPSSSKALAAAVLNSRRRKTASERQYQVIASWPVNSELQPSCVAQNCFDPMTPFIKIIKYPVSAGFGIWPMTNQNRERPNKDVISSQ